MDALAAYLVRRGEDYDVIVAENMFGDILSDLTGELSGSLDTAPSINSSRTQAWRRPPGSAPDIAGKNRANPTALFLSAAMLLGWLADRHGDERLAAAAGRIRHAVDDTVESGVATADLGGQASSQRLHRDRRPGCTGADRLRTHRGFRLLNIAVPGKQLAAQWAPLTPLAVEPRPIRLDDVANLETCGDQLAHAVTDRAVMLGVVGPVGVVLDVRGSIEVRDRRGQAAHPGSSGTPSASDG